MNQKDYNVDKLKEKIKKLLKNDEYYQELNLRRENIIDNLIKVENTNDRNELLLNYQRTGEEIKNLEIEMAYEIAKKMRKTNLKEKPTIKKVFSRFNKDKKNCDFNEEFNKIIKDSKYKQEVKEHEETFKKLIERPNFESNLLYELNSIDTQIAIIETEKVRDYIQRNMGE